MRALAFLALLLLPLHAEQVLFTQEQADLLFHTLVDAEATEDYDAFVADGTADWKATISKRMFEDSSHVLEPRLKGGFTIRPVGRRNEHDCAVFIYRLRFKDGGQDLRGTLSLKSGRIARVVFN